MYKKENGKPKISRTDEINGKIVRQVKFAVLMKEEEKRTEVEDKRN